MQSIIELDLPEGLANEIDESVRPEYLKLKLQLICPYFRFGSSGEAVATVEEILRISQQYGGKIDGEFSTLTQKAVRAFQKNFRIEADGIVSQETWTALSQIQRGYDPKWFLT